MFSFIESPLFTQLVAEYLTEAEYAALQQALQDNPEAGKVVVGSGGVRKLRWAAPGRGKSGGYRVIYFVKREPDVISDAHHVRQERKGQHSGPRVGPDSKGGR